MSTEQPSACSRCLHCDFEDKKKKKLEEHLMLVHKDENTNKERDIPLSKGMLPSCTQFTSQVA